MSHTIHNSTVASANEVQLPTVLDAEPVPDHAASASGLENFLNNGSYCVKEERALIQRRTVEPATTDTAADLWQSSRMRYLRSAHRQRPPWSANAQRQNCPSAQT